MRRMLKEITTNKDGDVVINNGVVVKNNGDTEIGRHLRVDGDIVVNAAGSIKDTSGNPVGAKFQHNLTITDIDSLHVANCTIFTESEAEITSPAQIPAGQYIPCTVTIMTKPGIGVFFIDAAGNYSVSAITGTPTENAKFTPYSTVVDELMVEDTNPNP